MQRNLDWLNHLSNSLMRSTITCGDWKKVLTKSYTFGDNKKSAIFLDPPYDLDFTLDNRNVYGVNDLTNVSTDVRNWCKDNSSNDLLKIVLCGYDTEHDELLEYGFAKVKWNSKQSSGYSMSSDKKIEYFWYK